MLTRRAGFLLLLLLVRAAFQLMLYAYGILSVIFFVMMVIKFWQFAINDASLRDNRVSKLRGLQQFSPFLKSFFRDGIIFFLL